MRHGELTERTYYALKTLGTLWGQSQDQVTRDAVGLMIAQLADHLREDKHMGGAESGCIRLEKEPDGKTLAVFVRAGEMDL